MNFQKLKTNIYCTGQKHYFGTKNIVGEKRFNKKTGREIKLLVGQCSLCFGKKSMIVSDNMIKDKSLCDFFKNLGESSVKVGKKIAKNVLKNPGRALDIAANIVTAAASRSYKMYYQ